jgi:hypothetical protein
VIDIDEYLTFAQGAHHAQAFFAQLLYRHAGRALARPDGGRLFESEADFVQAAFASDAFTRYVEGSEGLPRDSLEIAQKCASLAIDRQISLSHVNTACMERFDMFLVDLGCFVERINKGQLRLVDHGLRDLGIVTASQDRPGGRDAAVTRRAGYALVPAASRWH